MAKFLYVFYNLIYELGSLVFLLYANTYLNEGLVPNTYLLLAGKERIDLAVLCGVAIIKTLALLVEGAFLIVLIYLVNHLILSDTYGKERRYIIATRTAKISAVASLCFVVILIWGSFNGFLW
jgi:hypothetical protein